jgi:nicotinate dehydrogenase subunit B
VLDAVADIEVDLTSDKVRMPHEVVTFDSVRVTSLDWQGYPILRFAKCPLVAPVIVQRLDQRSTGAGDCSDSPLLPERVRTALA